jgi:hypothetical protein
MVEEEKLSHDVYVALAATTKDTRFTRIATAESQHMTAVRALPTRNGVADPAAGKVDGAFATDSVQQLYTDLVARGTASLDAALAVGRDIENLDITRLSEGSQRHLRDFGGGREPATAVGCDVVAAIRGEMAATTSHSTCRGGAGEGLGSTGRRTR